MLNDQSPNVQFTTSEDSQLNYVLVAYNQLPSFLTEEGGFADVANSSFANTAYDQNMSILEALLTTVPIAGGAENEGPSIFDMYAHTREEAEAADVTWIRDRVGRLIRRTQSSDSMTPVTSGSILTEEDIPQIQEFEQYMNMYTSYYCLAVARNVDGTEDGFKAISGINIPDRDPPTITVSGSSTQAHDGTWWGTVTLTFSEDLYWLSEDRETIREVWGVQPSNATQGARAIYILDERYGIGGSGASKLTLTRGATNAPNGSFTFSYTGMSEGDTLIFFSTGYASDLNMNGRGMETRQKTILTYTTSSGEESFLTRGHFIISQGELEGDSVVS